MHAPAWMAKKRWALIVLGVERVIVPGWSLGGHIAIGSLSGFSRQDAPGCDQRQTVEHSAVPTALINGACDQLINLDNIKGILPHSLEQ